MWESHLHGSERGWRTTLLWMRYCGTVGKPAGNREDKVQPKCLSEGNPHREVWLNRQKSAEGIVGGFGPTEGPNMSFRTGTFVSTVKER